MSEQAAPLPGGPATAGTPGRNPRRWLATFAALSEHDYAWYFSGNIAFFMGMQMQQILRGYLAYDLTNAGIALGLMAAAMALPMLVVAPFGGVVADRVNKRNLLIFTQTGSAVASFFLAILIISGAIEFWHLLAVSVVTGLIFSFNMPARQALVPQLVPQHKLMNAISLQMGGMNVTRILAPALAGLLIAPLGVGWVYVITCGLFLVATASEFHLPVHGMVGSQQRKRFREDFAGGFRYIRDNPMIKTLILLGLIFPLFGFPLQQMLPVFAEDVFNKGGSGLGILAAATGVGGLTGAMIAANLDGFAHKGRLMLIGGLWMGGLFIAFTQIPHFAPALVFLALGNVGGMIFQTTNNTVIQANLPSEVRGRVMSVMMMSFGLMPLGVLPTAAAADAFGARWAVAGSSTLLVVTVIGFFVVSKRLRTLRLDRLAHAELSPAQAATLVAQGKITQEEADRLTGHTPGQPAAAAPVLEVPRDEAHRPSRVAAVEVTADPRRLPETPAPRIAGPGHATALTPPPATPVTAALGAGGLARTPFPMARSVVVAGAVAVGVLLGFTASASGELARIARERIAVFLDPDS